MIVVNCIILGRAESYASKNGPAESAFDGLGMGLGFTVALTCIGLVREILGSGAVFGHVIIPEDYHIAIFVLAPGAFFVLSILTALQNKFKAPSATNTQTPKSKLACWRKLSDLQRLCLQGKPRGVRGGKEPGRGKGPGGKESRSCKQTGRAKGCCQKRRLGGWIDERIIIDRHWFRSGQ